MPRWQGPMAAVVAVVTTWGGTAAASAVPDAPARVAAPAAVTQVGGIDPVLVAGDFVGDAREELFVHRPGPTLDSLVEFTRPDQSSGVFTTRATGFAVHGTYRPVAADIDADDHDEIIWYAPGTAADYVWDFTDAGTVQIRPIRVDGTFRPVAGELTGGGNDEVLWYAPGGAADYLWTFDDAGGLTSVPKTVNGRGYLPAVGTFGVDDTEDILWYDPNAAVADSVWDFVAGTTDHTTHVVPAGAGYVPVALDMWGSRRNDDDVLWYGYGTRPDDAWQFTDGAVGGYPPQVAAMPERHDPIVTGDFLGNDAEQVLWFRDPPADPTRPITVWSHDVTVARQFFIYSRSTATVPQSAWQAGALGPRPPQQHPWTAPTGPLFVESLTP